MMPYDQTRRVDWTPTDTLDQKVLALSTTSRPLSVILKPFVDQGGDQAGIPAGVPTQQECAPLPMQQLQQVAQPVQATQPQSAPVQQVATGPGLVVDIGPISDRLDVIDKQLQTALAYMTPIYQTLGTFQSVVNNVNNVVNNVSSVVNNVQKTVVNVDARLIAVEQNTTTIHNNVIAVNNNVGLARCMMPELVKPSMNGPNDLNIVAKGPDAAPATTPYNPGVPTPAPGDTAEVIREAQDAMERRHKLALAEKNDAIADLQVKLAERDVTIGKLQSGSIQPLPAHATAGVEVEATDGPAPVEKSIAQRRRRRNQ